MKLAAIIMVWDDWDILNYCVKNISPLVDGTIIIWSRMSNYGEVSEPNVAVITQRTGNISAFNFEPNLGGASPRSNETNKRNFGLSIARQQGYTHFICLDSDEFYEPELFLREKARFLANPMLKGLVCPSQVYFKEPTLTIGLDVTRVPFIHKLTPLITHTYNTRYPFAWDKDKIRIDPTRSLNIDSGVEWSPIIMHHYSYVRKDLEKKIRNSTARPNLEKSSIREDFRLAKPGYYCNFYGKVLATAPNLFNLPAYNVLAFQNIQSLETDRAQKCADN